MRSTWLIAAVIAVVTIGWLVSGNLTQPPPPPAPSLADLRTQSQSEIDDLQPTRIRARVSNASARARIVKVRGRTESNRTVEVRAEVPGRVVALPLDKGDLVSASDAICEIDPQDRPERLVQAREAVTQAEIDYAGAVRLSKRGLQSQNDIAATRTRLAAARADLRRRELDLANTRIRAPFSGVIEDRPVEIGDFLQSGAICARIIDQDPILITGQVAEADIYGLSVGDTAQARLITGEAVSGRVAFIAQTASETTRTYRLEVEVPNPAATLRAGVTANLSVALEEVQAHRVAPSLLALDDQGEIGVRVLDASNRVQFVPVEAISEDRGGVWVAGLPAVTRIITVGQDLVAPGERVDVVLEAQSTIAAPSDPNLPTPESAPPQSSVAPAGGVITAAAAG